MSILDLFCSIDEFWQHCAPWWQRQWLASGARQRLRPTQLHPSEIMTFAILFQQSHYRTFKAFYTEHVQQHLRAEFPPLVSSPRFVELMPAMLLPLVAYLHTCLGTGTGISFIDSTPLVVCHPARIARHRVLQADAARGKTSVGWLYGFQLHLVVNDRGELLAFCLTRGNVDDRRPVPDLVARGRGRLGKLFGDRGYISRPLAERLLPEHGVLLITRLRRNMRNRLLALGDKLLLRKRALIETLTDQLKNICQIEHTRHRSPINFLVNLVGGLIANCHQLKKPALTFDSPLDLLVLAPSSLIPN